MCSAAWALNDSRDVILDTHTPIVGDHGYDTLQKNQIVDDSTGCDDQLTVNAIDFQKTNVKSVITVKNMQNQRTAGHLFTDLLRPPTAA